MWLNQLLPWQPGVDDDNDPDDAMVTMGSHADDDSSGPIVGTESLSSLLWQQGDDSLDNGSSTNINNNNGKSPFTSSDVSGGGVGGSNGVGPLSRTVPAVAQEQPRIAKTYHGKNNKKDADDWKGPEMVLSLPSQPPPTDYIPDVQTTDTLLAHSMNLLSMKQRDKVFEEVHGIVTPTVTTSSGGNGITESGGRSGRKQQSWFSSLPSSWTTPTSTLNQQNHQRQQQNKTLVVIAITLQMMLQ